MRRLSFALLLLSLPITGCAEFATLPPKTNDLLQSIPRVDNSPKSPCWQQRQIAAQNTALDTALKKTIEIYKAPCDVDAKPKLTASNYP